MNQFLLICIILFYSSWSCCQIVWQQHYETVEMDILSIANFEGGTLVDVAGLKNEQPFSTSLNDKKEIKTGNNFDNNFESNFDNKIPFLADFIYQFSKEEYLVAKNSSKGFQYGVINHEGKFLWKKTFNTTATIHAVSDIQSGGWILVGTDKKKMFAARLDEKGRVVWQETFGGSGELLDVVETAKGSFLMVGYVDLFQSGETDFFITQLNANGKNEWEKVFGEPEYLNEKARLVSITAEQQIIIAGHREDNIWMMQLTDKHEVKWEKEIKEKSYKFEPTAIYSQDNGTTFLAARASSTTQKPHLYMVQLNSYLMSAGNNLIGAFSLETLNGSSQRPLSVHYKPSNRYYQVTSDTRQMKELQFLGKYPNGYSVYILGVNLQGEIDLLPSKSSNASLRRLISLIDLRKHQYLIVLVANYDIDTQALQKHLQHKDDMIKGVSEVLGAHIMAKEKIVYDRNEMTAHSPLSIEGIVPFFIKIK